MTNDDIRRLAKATDKAAERLTRAERIAREIALDPLSETLVRIGAGDAFYVRPGPPVTAALADPDRGRDWTAK